MNRIEEFYRTVGSLIPNDPIANNNVYHAAEIIGNSPFVQMEDRRSITQATMYGVQNVLRGYHTVGGHSFMRGERAFSYKDLDYIFDTVAIVRVARIHDRYVRIVGQAGGNMGRTLTMDIQEVLYGINPFLGVRQYMSTFPIDEDGNSDIDHVQQGEYYLVRMVKQADYPTAVVVDIFPLFDDVYFVNANDATAMEAAFTTMENDLATIYANSHMLMLTGTQDMTLLPLVQSGVYERFQGRFITHEDYQDGNHVMVVPQRLDSLRSGARVGETVTLTLRDMRTFTDGAPLPPTDHPLFWQIPEGAEAHWRNIPAGYFTSIPTGYGGWQDYPYITIEVEVVGTYFVSDRWGLPRWAHISDNFWNMEAFVPASIIPEGWGIVDAHILSGAYSFLLRNPDDDVAFMAAYGAQLTAMGFSVQFVGEDPTNFLMSAVPIRNSIRINLLLFSAVLAVVLALTVFLFLRQRYKEFAILRALGISQGSATWQVAVPVLLFWLPIVIAASIGAWYFALDQAATSLQILAELGTHTDQGQAVTVMNFLDRMRFDAEMAAAVAIPELSMVYLVWLAVGMIVAWLCAVLVGTLSFASKSMISLIQGVNSGGAPTRAMRETAPPANVKISDIAQVLSMVTGRMAFGKLRSAIRHHCRHVLRAPVKTTLVLGMALLFIVALGWLDRTITFTENEIERLYATTVITGQVYDPAAGIGAMWGHGIPDSSLRILYDSGFIEDIYVTALANIRLMPPFGDREVCEQNRTLHNFVGDRAVKTFSSWDRLMYDIYRPVAFGVALTGDFEITFAEGFGPEDFNLDIDWATYALPPDDEDEEYEVDEPTFDEMLRIPVIVHESALTAETLLDPEGREEYFVTQHGMPPAIVRYILDDDGNAIVHTMQLGDEAYVVLSNWSWLNAVPVVIAGVYSGGHPGFAYRMGQGLILTQQMRFNHWATAEFTIRPEKIRYTHEFTEYINDALMYQIMHTWYDPQWGYQHWSENFTHQAELFDAEFRMVIVPLEENLHLLRILYPVAQVMSFVLALGLSLLLMLQNAKVVAILRVLGQARYKTRFNLGMEQLLVCLAGVAVGFIGVMFMGIGLGTAGLLVGIYLGGALLGTLVGVLVISYKTPLELLQVRE